MKNIFIWISILLLSACSSTKLMEMTSSDNDELMVAFGSCNDQKKSNKLWKVINNIKPDVWIWGGDNVYSDTGDTMKLWKDYTKVLNHPEYKKLRQSAVILGTWDDHDYGINDGGAEFDAKDDTKEMFLDFMEADSSDPRRKHDGIYTSQIISTGKKSIKFIMLDTRYFRSELTKSKSKGRRYEANEYGEGTILGNEQWEWLEEELAKLDADYHIIVTSIQFLSSEHGFEKWANMPHEIDRMLAIIKKYDVPRVIFLSGDRHISEFSILNDEEIGYPVIDFTSSGLTNVYSSYSGEPNKYRHDEVVNKKSFGTLSFDTKTDQVTFKMIGENGVLLNQYVIKY